MTRALIGRGARGTRSSWGQVCFFLLFPLENQGQDRPSSNLGFSFLMSIADMNFEVVGAISVELSS